MCPFFEGLSQALDYTVETSSLVSIGETHLIFESFCAGYRAAQNDYAIIYRRFFPQEREEIVFTLARCIAHRLTNDEVFFITKLAGDCWVINVKISNLLTHAEAVIKFDGDSISILSKDRNEGLLIDRNFDDSQLTYEVTVWGDKWPLIFLACDQNI